MLIETQNREYCNTKYIVSVKIQDFYSGSIDHALHGVDIMASMVNGKTCILGSYDSREEAEEKLEKLIRNIGPTNDQIYRMPK